MKGETIIGITEELLGMKLDNTIGHTIIPIVDSDDNIYVVTAYRNGNRDSHSYVAGVYGSQEIALESASKEESFRYDKYKCEVVEMKMNTNIWDGGCRTIKRDNNEDNRGEVC
jgi:hypothetical protein